MRTNKAIRFRQLHRSGDCFIMPNAWDAGSAVLLAQAGFEAIGTTSAGVVMGLSGSSLSLAQLRAVGVSRISIGGSLARATLGLVRRAAQEMLEQGSFGFAREQIPDAELCALFSNKD